MLKMVDGTGIIGVDMVCPLGGAVSPPQPPNYDKVEVEGVGNLMLPNSLKAPLERLELIGNSVQPTTTGKNLFDPKQLQGISGFTIEGNEITQSGYNVSTGKTLKQLCPEITPGTYILSASNGDFTGLFGLSKPMYKKSAVEVTEDDLNKTVALVGNLNKAIKYKLQIEKGSTTTPYEPYTGLKPSPSPEYPQEIKSAGKYDEASGKYLIDVKVTGKNLVPHVLDFMKFGNNDPKTIVFDEKTNSCKLEMRSDNFNQVTCHVKFKLKKGTYVIRRKIKIEGVDIANPDGLKIMNSDTKEVLYHAVCGISRVFELPKDTNIAINIGHMSGEKQTEAIIYDLQLEEGTVETDYEPYQEPQTLTLTSDHPITKWDKLVEQGGEYGWLYGGKIIDSYNSEPIDTEYMSSTGQLSIGATVLYRLKESEFTPLSQEEQTQLRNLHSYNGTTHITVDSGEVECGIKLTYRKEK